MLRVTRVTQGSSQRVENLIQARLIHLPAQLFLPYPQHLGSLPPGHRIRIHRGDDLLHAVVAALHGLLHVLHVAVERRYFGIACPELCCQRVS